MSRFSLPGLARPVASSVRVKLIVAFAAVITLSLLLASGAFAYLVREYQVQREKDRLESAAIGAASQVFLALRRGAPLAELEGQVEQVALAQRVRILLLSEHGTVLRDTDGNRLANQSFAVPPQVPPGAAGRRPGIFQGNLVTPTGDTVFAVVPQGLGSPGPAYRVAVIAPEQSLAGAWGELVPRLSLAALGSFLLSIGIAGWLASSITRPLAHITRAAEEMARGNLAPRLAAAETDDEVGRLARAFGAMSREVARSHRAMRDLLANVSHDLRTPLTSIQGYAGALVDGTLGGEQGAREAGRVIAEEAERMRRLVEDLLYLGRIESGQLSIERQPVELGSLVRAAARRFALRAEERRVHLRVAADPSTEVMVLGDVHRLAQVLDNLLENALRHTPEGGEITVTVAQERARRGQRPESLLSVHNTGSCIPAEELDRVFERFYQLDKARAAKDGRGLGLAIVQEVVQALGGSVSAQSAPGAGTTLNVHLQTVESPQGPRLESPDVVGRGPALAPASASNRH